MKAMTLEQARSKARNPTCFHHGDRYVVVNTDTGEPIESHFNERSAIQAAQWCNDHEQLNDRPGVYSWEALA